MSVEQMKSAVESVYPGKKWKLKVSKMSSTQIVAVYYNFLACKKLK
jgi:hypothetical protein